MRRKGFTLIELLAVIVILAIIALIATPTILGVIEKARKGAAEQSALGYIDAVEKQVAINQVRNENLINDGIYDVPMNGVSVKGEAPTKGWLKIEKGLVTNYSFVIGKYVVTKGSEIVKGENATNKPTTTNRNIVYRNTTDQTKLGDIIDIDNLPDGYSLDKSDISTNNYLKMILDDENKIKTTQVCIKFIGDYEELCMSVDDNFNISNNKLIAYVNFDSNTWIEEENGGEGGYWNSPDNKYTYAKEGVNIVTGLAYIRAGYFKENIEVSVSGNFGETKNNNTEISSEEDNDYRIWRCDVKYDYTAKCFEDY